MRSPESRSYRSGVKAGMFSLMTFGRHRSAPAKIRKTVGSRSSDREARYRDAHAVSDDVKRAERVVVHS